MSRTRRFLKELAGPHVLFACLIGVVAGVTLRGLHHDVPALPDGVIPNRAAWPAPKIEPLTGYPGVVQLEDIAGIRNAYHASIPRWLIVAALGVLCAAAAIAAKRLTGNTLVSACAGGILVLLPTTRGVLLPALDEVEFGPGIRPWAWAALGELVAAAFGLLAAGVRLLPGPGLESARILGKRELLALLLLVGGSFFSPSILAMPILILIGDLAYSPWTAAQVLRRGASSFLLHAAAVAPAIFFLPSLPRYVRLLIHTTEIDTGFGLLHWLPSPGWVVIPIAFALNFGALLLRSRIQRTLVVAVVFAIAWTLATELPRYFIPEDRRFHPSILALFGVALLIPTILWRVAIALTQPRRPEQAEPPIPSVPALRDIALGSGPEGGRRSFGSMGLASTVETAVASAVAATLDQIRLAFRGRQASESPGVPEQVLWNRLITGNSGGVLPAEKPADAVARWKRIYDEHLKPWLPDGARIVCAGATPWPLVAALAGGKNPVILVERSLRAAQVARTDLAPVLNARVIRHDGRRLDAIADGAAFAVVALFESAREVPAEVVAFLRECRRVLQAGGVVAFGFADLALPASQEALVRTSPSEVFLVREALEALAKLAGLRIRAVTPGFLPTISLAWLERPA